MSIKHCSRCGTEFSCSSPERGCWCEQYSLTGETLANLKKTYADCLCPGCLAGIAEKQEDAQPLQNI